MFVALVALLVAFSVAGCDGSSVQRDHDRCNLEHVKDGVKYKATLVCNASCDPTPIDVVCPQGYEHRGATLERPECHSTAASGLPRLCVPAGIQQEERRLLNR